MKLLAFFFWFFVALYLLRLVARVVLRGFLARHFRQQAPEPRRKKEGEVTIERIDTPEKKVDKKVGEYVEFEEID